jgi:SAM-dependent methyltransferase
MVDSVGSGSLASAAPDANSVYALGTNPAESARLQRQAEELAGDSVALLDKVAVGPGHNVIDLGCGPRGIVDLLAARVSPGGRVVGLDADPVHTGMVADLVASLGLDRVEIITADARRSGLPSGSFDLVHARTLLINVPDPGEVVAEMVRLAKPGGWVASMEPDTEFVLCHPPNAAYEHICKIFPLVFARNGADPHMGRRVPGLLREAGLEEVGVDVRAQVYPPGHTRRTVKLDLVRSMRPQVLELGLATETELEEWDASAREHLQQPQTVCMTGHLFLSWGRKPL